MKLSMKRILTFVIVIAAVSVLAHYCKQNSPNRDDAKLKEVEQMYAALPIYPGFQEVAHNWFSKDILASVSKSYKYSVN